MKDYLEVLINKHKKNGAFLDANLALLLLVGQVDRNHISVFKRTSSYTAEDYLALMGILKNFRKIVTTPNVLTEVNNLAGALAGKHKDAFMSVFSRYIEGTEERYLQSNLAMKEPGFLKYGITDVGAIWTCRSKYLLISDDFKMVAPARAAGVDVLNFNYIRQALMNVES